MPEGIKIYVPGEPEGKPFLSGKNLTLDKLVEAITVYQSVNYELKTLLGIDEEGFYGSHAEDWESSEYITFIPWVQIYEMLGMVEANTTREFIEGGGKLDS